MDPKDLLFFDKMIVPKIILVIYWLLVVLCVLGGLVGMFTTGFFAGLMVIIFGPLAIRIYCELMIVIFKINAALQDIKNK